MFENDLNAKFKNVLAKRYQCGKQLGKNKRCGASVQQNVEREREKNVQNIKHPHTDAVMLQDVGATLLMGTLRYIFVKANAWAAEKGCVNPKDSGKIIHTLSAPLFVAFWPPFSTAFGARFFAASVSLTNACHLCVAGSGGDKSLAFAVSRSGDSKEALEVPFFM